MTDNTTATASIHPPPFSKHPPATLHNQEAWFFSVETIFRSKISTSHKANDVLKFLPDDVFEQKAEWLADQMTTVIYEAPKDQLRPSFSMLPALKAKKFLDNVGAATGDQQPSQVYKQLR
ncbi:uncharacterized protein LOC135207951 [Macrobrachium nipponense]|uniref:uncharacterized protein LOC135207951 n=1 Tax=Macrobrachium nipponense TaxID=159736 RepID=UPI0030C7DD9E